jgi:hypothetical protein
MSMFSTSPFSEVEQPTAYTRLLRRGPFPGRIDPFAEDDRYFNQIHSGMINAIINQISEPLLQRGYILSKEASLQSTGNRNQHVAHLQCITIYDAKVHTLEAIIEIIAPSIKLNMAETKRYRRRRNQLFNRHHVYVIEMDLTRSVNHLFDHAAMSLYNTVTFVPPDGVRLIAHTLTDGLKRYGLSLRGEIMPIDLQPAYDTAYQQAVIAAQIRAEEHYKPEYLPFPALLTTVQHDTILRAVEIWQAELKRLRGS